MTAPIATCIFSSVVPFCLLESLLGCQAVVSRLAGPSTTPPSRDMERSSRSLWRSFTPAPWLLPLEFSPSATALMEYNSSMLWHVQQGQKLRRISTKRATATKRATKRWTCCMVKPFKPFQWKCDFIAFVRICSPNNHNKYHFWTNICRSRNPNPIPPCHQKRNLLTL